MNKEEDERRVEKQNEKGDYFVVENDDFFSSHFFLTLT
jgi:hypothetical protein